MLKRLFARLQRGQAIIEYMPTIAGAMVLAMLSGIAIGGGVRQSYCKVVDAVGDRPASCETEDTGTPANEPDGIPDPDNPDDPDNPVPDPSCAITLDSADGPYPNGWNTEWTEGEVDTLRVNVANLAGQTVTWSLKLRFPTDPDSVDTEIKSGEFDTDGEHLITLPYPLKGEWGPVSTDGFGTYESHATLHISGPCNDVGWDRWYKAPWTADLGIGITHDVSPVTQVDETLTYTVTVTNNGPNASQIYNGEGTVVNLPAPAGVTVLSASPSQGECDTQIVCDLGELPVLGSATITVKTTVADPANCLLTGTSTVSAARPPDPNSSNNQATTIPTCELTCNMSIASFDLVDADTDQVIAQLSDGAEITLDAGQTVNLIANTSGSIGSVRFWLDGAYVTNENAAPYAIAGDNSGDFKAWSITPGTHTVNAIPYALANGGGDSCGEDSVTFTLVEATPEPTACVTSNQLGVATDFNTFTLGNHSSPSGSDTEGRMAVGGTATLGSYSVGYELGSSWSGKDVLVVGGDLNFTSGTVYYGNTVVGGNQNVGGSATTEGELKSGNPVDFSAANSYLKSLSTLFANTEANGTTTNKWSCAIQLDGTDEKLNVFSVDGSDLNGLCQLDINIPSGSTALINVSGGSITWTSGGFMLNGQSATPSGHDSPYINDVAKIIFNFPSATSITIPYGGVSGTILAPKASMNFNSGVVWGTVVTGSFSGTGQLNHVPFQGCVPSLTN